MCDITISHARSSFAESRPRDSGLASGMSEDSAAAIILDGLLQDRASQYLAESIGERTRRIGGRRRSAPADISVRTNEDCAPLTYAVGGHPGPLRIGDVFFQNPDVDLRQAVRAGGGPPERAARGRQQHEATTQQIDRRNSPVLVFQPDVRRATAGVSRRQIFSDGIVYFRRFRSVGHDGRRLISCTEDEAALVEKFLSRQPRLRLTLGAI